jgi:outer membrane receptor for monomeric catechols
MRHRFLARYDYSDQYNFTSRTGDTPGASNANLLPLPPVPVPAFAAGAFVDTAPIYTNFPISRVDYSDNRFHRVTLQDQIDPVRWIGVNVVVSRPNFDRRARNDSFNNGVFVTAGADTHVANHSRNNYRIGAALRPQESWPVWTRGFQPYFSYNSSFNPVTQIPADGSQLNPVINKSWEVGNKWQGLKGRLSVLTAIRRIQDLNRVVTISAGVFQQVGKASTYNMDLDVNGALGRGFAVIANYGYADSLIERFRTDGLPQTNGGNRFPQAPKHLSRIWLTKSLHLGQESRLNFSLGGRYVRHYFTNTANTAIVPSATTFDGAISLTRRKYDVVVNFANLLNAQRYFVSQINSTQLYPGPPINATLTLRYRF